MAVTARTVLLAYLAALAAVALYLHLQLVAPGRRPFATTRSRQLVGILWLVGALDATLIGLLLASAPAYVIAPSLVALLAIGEPSVRAIPEGPLTKFISLGAQSLFYCVCLEMNRHKAKCVRELAETLNARIIGGPGECFRRTETALRDWAATAGISPAPVQAASDLRACAVEAEHQAHSFNDERGLRKAENDQREQFLALLCYAYDQHIDDELRLIFSQPKDQSEHLRAPDTQQSPQPTARRADFKNHPD